MGGLSHRIEVLLVGVVLLLGSAFAAAASLLPHRGVVPFEQMRQEANAAQQSEALAIPELPAPQLPTSAAVLEVVGSAVQSAQVIVGQTRLEWWLALAGLVGAFAGVRALRRDRLVRIGGVSVRLLSHVRRVWQAAWVAYRNRAPREAIRVAPLIVDLPSLTPEAVPVPLDAFVPIEDEQDAGHASATPHTMSAPHEWTADELANTVAAALAHEWRTPGLRSRVTALDAEVAGGRVRVVLEADPADGNALLALPARLAQTNHGWSARWRGAVLEVSPQPGLRSGTGAPLLVPLLRHGRRARLVRYLPLSGLGTAGETRHLGFYGAAAVDALHSSLASLLYAHSPATLAVAVLEAGTASPLYAAAPHAVALPGSARTTIAALDRTLRRGWERQDMRHLVLAVVEPEPALLADLAGLLVRARMHQSAPLTILLAQRQPHPAGREVYAALPALVTHHQHGDAQLLSAKRWPRKGTARLVVAHTHLEGTPLLRDEAAMHAALRALQGVVIETAPTLLNPIGTASHAQAARRLEFAPKVTDDALAVRLAHAVRGRPYFPESHADTNARQEDDAGDDGSSWPHGPGTLAPADVEALIAQVLSDPSITSAVPPGLTKNRVSALLPLALRPDAAAVMTWLDDAGLLAPPRDELLRWREPRPLCETDPDAIATRLRQTSLRD